MSYLWDAKNSDALTDPFMRSLGSLSMMAYKLSTSKLATVVNGYREWSNDFVRIFREEPVLTRRAGLRLLPELKAHAEKLDSLRGTDYLKNAELLREIRSLMNEHLAMLELVAPQVDPLREEIEANVRLLVHNDLWGHMPQETEPAVFFEEVLKLRDLCFLEPDERHVTRYVEEVMPRWKREAEKAWAIRSLTPNLHPQVKGDVRVTFEWLEESIIRLETLALMVGVS